MATLGAVEAIGLVGTELREPRLGWLLTSLLHTGEIRHRVWCE